MPKNHPAEDVSWKQLNLAKTLSVSAWENQAGITPGAILILFTGHHRGHHKGKRWFSRGSWAVACYLWLDPWPSVLCVEHTRNLSLPPPPRHVMEVYFKKKKLHKPRHQQGEFFDTEKDKLEITGQHQVGQKVVDWQILPKIKDFPQLQGFFCPVFSYKWSLSSQTGVLTNFLQRI